MKRQDNSTISVPDNSTDAGDVITIADSSVDFSDISYDTAAAADESTFQIVDVTNTTASNSTDGYDLPSLDEILDASANATLDLTNSSDSTSNDTTLDTSIGTTWTTLYDPTKSVMLSANADGNMYLAQYINITSDNPQTTILFDSAEGIVATDYLSRMFVYFPISMQNYNASRLRLVDDPYIPIGSRLVTLTPLQIGSQAIYVAVDSLGNMFQMAYCMMESGAPKIFIVDDPDSGTANLMSEEIRWSVTGGVMRNCSTLALTGDLAGFDVGAS